MEVVDIPDSDWASKHVKTIICTQDVNGTTYELKVKKFKPADGDALARRWKRDGVERQFACAPYAVANMREASKTLARHVDESIAEALRFYITESDNLLRQTYIMAYNYSQNAEVSGGLLRG
jgi:hypothetical protein